MSPWHIDAPRRKQNPVSSLETGFSSEGDGARTRNHRIDSPAKNRTGAIKTADSQVCLSAACPETPPHPDAAELAGILPRLTAKQRRQLLALARSMIDIE